MGSKGAPKREGRVLEVLLEEASPFLTWLLVVSWFKGLIKCCFVGSGDLLRWFKVVLVVILG